MKKVYNPEDPFQEVQKADHVAALGQAAVVVQSIGGEGALCAMDEWTYEGVDVYGNRSTASSFKKVFADELTGGKKDFEKNGLLWEEDGTAKGNLSDDNFDKLVERVGANGVIFFPGEYGDESTYFTSSQLEDLEYASVQLVPVDMRTVQGIKDAVTAVGDCLSESTELEEGWSSKTQAKTYNKALDAIVKGVGNTRKENKGMLLTSPRSTQARKFTSYSSMPLSSSASYPEVVSCVAIDFQTGIKYTSDNYKVPNCSSGLLFTHLSYTNSPVSFWLESAGVYDNTADVPVIGDNTDQTLLPVWQFGYASSLKRRFSASTAGPVDRLNDNTYGGDDTFDASDSSLNLVINESLAVVDDAKGFNGGLGSSVFPYLIVSSSSSGLSANEVRKAVIAEMDEEGSPYYATENCAASAYMKNADDAKRSPYASNVGEITACIGWKYEKADAVSVFRRDSGQSVSFSETVIANPAGLLGSWTTGTMESVLESVWVAQVYSTSPENSDYDPITDMDDFKADVDGDGSDETSFKEAVVDFYKMYYHLDDSEAAQAYSDVTSDASYGL